MVKRVFAVLTCFFMLAMASGAIAGGVVNPAPAPMAPCAPAPCGPAMGNPCAYWGDAPFPGLCGGVVALPFLVVGSLLGGSTSRRHHQLPWRRLPMVSDPAWSKPAPWPLTAPVPCAPAPVPAQCGPAAYGSAGLFGGIPCLELCSSILGSFSGVAGFGAY